MSAPDDVPFTPYDKIASSPRDWGLDERATREVERARWVVTEKIHGANFCAISDGEGVRFAKRKQLLEEGEAFFGWQALREELEEAALALAAWARGSLEHEFTHVMIYGELFGGGYPHPEVEAVPGVAPIQTGVWYAPDVRFHAFDVAWCGDDEVAHYLGYEDARRGCVEAGFGWCEALLIGTLSEAMAAPVRFASTVPGELGLPELDDNVAEGVVLKPLEPLELDGSRPVLKRKIEEFAEDARYQGARAWSPPPRLEWALDLLEWEVTQRVVGARVDAARSKIGARPTREDDLERWRSEIADEVTRDVFEELAHEHADALAGVDAEERAFAEALARELALAHVGRA